VFEHIGARRSSTGMARHATHDVPRLVKRLSSTPVAVRRARSGLARPTRRGRRLLGLSAGTEVSGREPSTGGTQKVPARWLEQATAAPALLHCDECSERMFAPAETRRADTMGGRRGATLTRTTPTNVGQIDGRTLTNNKADARRRRA
jgi:hypothetical protein